MPTEAPQELILCRGGGSLSKLLSDLHQRRQLRPGLPQLLGLREDIPAGRTVPKPKGEAGVGELGWRGEQEVVVRQQEVHLQA